MNPIHHIRLNDDDDSQSTLAVDLGAIAGVGRPNPNDRVWGPNFSIAFTGNSTVTRPEFLGWDWMVEQRQLLVAAWEAYRSQPPVTPTPAKDLYTTISNYSGMYEVPVCLTGIRNMVIVEGNEAEPTCELYIAYADGKSEQYAFANVKMLQLAVNTINLALIRE